jgi:hypothetical protein
VTSSTLDPRPSVVLRIAATAIAASAVTACGESTGFEFRMYDTRHQAKVEILTSDLVRSSVKVGTVPGNRPSIYIKLTDRGESKFHRLSRILAKRGKRLHAIQQLAIEINGKVYDRVGVDYKVYPDGLNADTGLEILSFDDLATARRLANEMRSG